MISKLTKNVVSIKDQLLNLNKIKKIVPRTVVTILSNYYARGVPFREWQLLHCTCEGALPAKKAKHAIGIF